MKKLGLLFISAFLLSLAVSAEGHSTPDKTQTTWIVEFAKVPSQNLQNILRQQGFKIGRLSPYHSRKTDYFDRAWRVSGPPENEFILRSHTEILNVENTQSVDLYENEIAKPDLLRGEQWALNNTGAFTYQDITSMKFKKLTGKPGQDIGWQKASKFLNGKKLKPVIVAVLDTGVDYLHAELIGRIATNDAECENGLPPEDPKENDLDHNGYAGDCMGINLASDEPTRRNKPLDDHSHGTHIASLMAAVTGNGVGIQGLSSNIRILPIKVIENANIHPKQAGSDRVAEGILYAISRGAKVVNISSGWAIAGETGHVREAIKEATRNGVFIVAAAGNDGHQIPVFPCSYHDVICVGGIQRDGELIDYSNYGAHVDLAAPGESILGAYPTHWPDPEDPTFQTQVAYPHYTVRGYAMKSGTSQSAPYVAGTLAVLSALYPEDSRSLTLARLLGSTAAIPEGPTSVNFGSLKFDKALTTSNLDVVRFVFKDVAVLPVANDGQVTLPVEIENLGPSSQMVNWTITSKNPQIQIADSTGDLQMSGQSSQTLKISAVVLKTTVANQWDFEVHLVTNSQNQKVKAQVQIARPLATASEVETYPVENSQKFKRITSVVALGNPRASQHFVTYEENADGLQMSFWRRGKSRLEFIGQAMLKGSVAPLGAFMADADFDGQDDFIIPALTADQNSRVLQIFYFNRDLKPLFGTQSELRLEGPEYFNLTMLKNYTQVQWFRHHLVQGPDILMPSIHAYGFKPVDGQKKVSQDHQETAKLHIYYLEPSRDDNHVLALHTKIADSDTVVADIRQKLGLRYYEGVEAITHLIPSQKERAANEAVFLLKAGQLDQAKSLQLNLGGSAGVSWRVLEDWGQHPYSDYDTYPLWSHSSSGEMQIQNLLYKKVVGVNSSADLIVVDPENREKPQISTVMSIPDESVNILNLLLKWRDGDNLKTVVETGQKLVAFSTNTPQGGAFFSQQPIARSTFMGGFFTQMTTEIMVGQSEPAIFVNNTKLNSNNIFVWRLQPDGTLQAPLYSSFILPAGCNILEPSIWQGESAYRLNFSCVTENGLEFRTLLLR